MTERTVTIQTEEEQTVTLCDECGLSDDAGEIVTYVPMPAEPKEMVEGDTDDMAEEWAKIRQEYETLHLHRPCLDRMGVEVPEGQTLSEIDTLFGEGELEYPINMVLTKMERNMLVLGIGILTFAGYIIGSGSTLWGAGLGVVGSFFVFVALGIGIEQANKTVDELQ